VVIFNQGGEIANIMRKALTIPEVLVAAIFLTVVLSGILMLFINCMFLNEANRNSTVAITHAQYIMEEIRSAPFSSIQTMDGNGDWDLDADELQASPYNLDGEREILDSEEIKTSVNDVSSTEGLPPATLLEVIVEVSWQDRRGRSRSEQIVTRIAEYQ